MKSNFPKAAILRRVPLLILLSLLSSDKAVAADPGAVVAWGNNANGQSTVPTNLTDVVAIAAGGFHSLAVRVDGTVIAWGRNDAAQTNVPVGLSNVVAVSGGGYFSLALKTDGTVVGWGDNGLGQLNVPSTLSNVVAIAAGWNHSLALKADGTVVGWGQNNHGQAVPPQSATNVQAIAAAEAHSIALKRDGNVIGWGQTTPPTLTGIVAIAASGYHDLALKGDRTVVGWGMNEFGQSTMPVNLTGVVAVAAGYFHSLALKEDGTVVGWGANAQGQSTVPTNLSGVAALAGGYSHSLALQGPVAPFGTPQVTVNGVVTISNAFSRGSATISLTTSFENGAILYTLDGSNPLSSGVLYEGPFVVHRTATLRAIAYNADFTQSAQSALLEIHIVPTLIAITDGGGNVAIDPPAGAYFSNETAMVTATPAPNWTFLQWLGDATGTNPTTSVSMSRNKCVQAVFGTALDTTVVGSGSVISTPIAEFYPYATRVRLTAVPQAGNYFVLWGNAANSTNNPLILAVTNGELNHLCPFCLTGRERDSRANSGSKWLWAGNAESACQSLRERHERNSDCPARCRTGFHWLER